MQPTPEDQDPVLSKEIDSSQSEGDLMDTRPETPLSISTPPGPPEAPPPPRDLGQEPSVAISDPVLLESGQTPADGSAEEDERPSVNSRGFPMVPDDQRPSFLFLGTVAAVSLFADISTKVWAEIVINQRGFEPIAIIGDNVNITLAYNQGGAWGLFASAEKMVRLPFFLSVSVFAVFFIVSLYSRLHPSQKALKWGLPLVLGGALGNLSDRITRSQVIDFIDYRADWVMSLNAFINQYVPSWTVTEHWPTFNVADIAICIGVALMGVDMLSHRHRAHSATIPPSAPPPPSTSEVVAS